MTELRHARLSLHVHVDTSSIALIHEQSSISQSKHYKESGKVVALSINMPIQLIDLMAIVPCYTSACRALSLLRRVHSGLIKQRTVWPHDASHLQIFMHSESFSVRVGGNLVQVRSWCARCLNNNTVTSVVRIRLFPLYDKASRRLLRSPCLLQPRAPRNSNWR